MIFFLLNDISIIGGVEKTTLSLVNELNKNSDVKCKIFTFFNENKIKDENISLLKCTSWIKYVKYIKAFRLLYNSGASKIVTSYFIFNVFNIICSKFFGYKSIIQEHSSFHYDSYMKRIVKIIIYRYADKFIVLNNYDLKKYEDYGLKPELIYNYIPLKENVNNISFVSDNDFFLISSRIDKNKRINLAIDAFLKYKEIGGKFNLVVCGDGPEFEKITNKYNKNKNIIFKGMVDCIDSYMANAKGLILTSKLECLPTVIIEAKNHGIPVIAFSVPSGVPEMIENECDGYLIKDGDILSMANKLYLLEDKNIFYEMSNKSKLSCLKYENKQVLIQYREVLKDI